MGWNQSPSSRRQSCHGNLWQTYSTLPHRFGALQQINRTLFSAKAPIHLVIVHILLFFSYGSRSNIDLCLCKYQIQQDIDDRLLVSLHFH